MSTDRHHAALDAIAPWDRRREARATGRKCERSQLSRAYRDARKADRKRAIERDTRAQIREALGR